MADKMLIDASHAEETRVVVVRGNRIEEFDFESQHKKQLRGNIYLAKVTRVEPSLQAAFVDYGGNRHGFLAFAEIHPDYYQIPLADRQALLRAEAEEHRRDEEFESVPTASNRGRGGRPSDEDRHPAAVLASDDAPQPIIESWQGEITGVATEGLGDDAAETPETTEPEAVTEAVARDVVPAEEAAPAEPAEEKKPVEKAKRVRKPRARKPKAEASTEAEPAAESAEPEAPASNGGNDDNGSTPPAMAMVADIDTISEDAPRRGNDDDDDDDEDDGEKEVIESVGAEDAMEEVPDRIQRKPRKQYRIQEVIKRRQILLVQVAKEERGNKGAALTTYLSLAGRYSVLMPNTARGGGISRKITSPQDRKRLKEIAKDLEVPNGMGVILRTAGANRTKAEVKRDFEYLMRLWENVRTKTLQSTAPCLVYEEGSLIKRSIRDLYNKDIGEIIVSGEEGYREAKDFMKMLMPSHAKVVQPYRDIHPIFSRAGIEAQLDRMLQPQVTLRSGGYIIINQTEALVSIDVNSGRSTREHSIEDTALQTNLEAAEEVARQLRLRDLAGLVVIDFIDMEEKRNNRHVEKRLKDHLKNDRARIQVGRISHFGLLEMSRQRIRASVLESTMQTCPHCGGTGHIRSQSSVALHVLRGIEEFLLKSTTHDIVVHTQADTALYLLNHKRVTIVDYENRFGVSIIIEADGAPGGPHFTIERGEAVENPVKIDQLIHFPVEEEEEDDIPVEEEEVDEAEEKPVAAQAAPAQQSSQPQSGEGASKKKRRRRRRSSGSKPTTTSEATSTPTDGTPSSVTPEQAAADEENDADEDDDGDEDEDETEGEETSVETDSSAAEAAENETAAATSSQSKKRRRGKRGGRRGREGTPGEGAQGDEAAEAIEADSSDDDDDAADAEPEAAAPIAAAQPAAAEPVASVAETEDATAEEKPRRSNRGEAALSSSTRAVVTSSNTERSEEENKPKKAGWWQKRGFL